MSQQTPDESTALKKAVADMDNKAMDRLNREIQLAALSPENRRVAEGLMELADRAKAAMFQFESWINDGQEADWAIAESMYDILAYGEIKDGHSVLHPQAQVNPEKE